MPQAIIRSYKRLFTTIFSTGDLVDGVGHETASKAACDMVECLVYHLFPEVKGDTTYPPSEIRDASGTTQTPTVIRTFGNITDLDVILRLSASDDLEEWVFSECVVNGKEFNSTVKRFISEMKLKSPDRRKKDVFGVQKDNIFNIYDR